MSRDKILHDSWSISAALAKGFSDRHFERGEGPGDEVATHVTPTGDNLICAFVFSASGFFRSTPSEVASTFRTIIDVFLYSCNDDDVTAYVLSDKRLLVSVNCTLISDRFGQQVSIKTYP